MSVAGPIKTSDTEHHPEDDGHRPHMLLHCNGAVLPDMDHSPFFFLVYWITCWAAINRVDMAPTLLYLPPHSQELSGH